jgi:rhodanese-related sulfurtransferase
MRLAALLTVALLGLAGCGSSSDAEPVTPEATTATPAGVQLLSPTDAAGLISEPGVLVLDVRTAEEFAEGHLTGAEQLDWYAPDFPERVAELDREATWVVYCRSGNRSSQATALMADQGFDAVSDVDGGIVAWQAAGLPVEQGAS